MLLTIEFIEFKELFREYEWVVARQHITELDVIAHFFGIRPIPDCKIFATL